ncbi:MAG: pYEATS domain-containing protein [Sandaracinaceae bacterium]
MTLSIAQSSTYEGDDWWSWSVWVEGPERELDAVRHVTYKLHATFPNPIRRVDERRTKFRLESGGWGVFKLFATCELQGGETRTLEHQLTLEYPADAEEPGEEADPDARPQVFLSYAAEDTGAAARVRDALERLEIRVRDSDSLPPGEPLAVAASAAIDQSDVFVLLAQDDGPISPWVADEARAASAADLPVVLVGQPDQYATKGLRNVTRLSASEAEHRLPELVKALPRRRKSRPAARARRRPPPKDA